MKIVVERSELVDSLPYIDAPITEEEQSIVNEMIREEMSKFNPPDYLSQLPTPHSFNYNNFQTLENEFNRLENGKPMDTLNLSRYKVEKPQGESKQDVNAWKSAVDNAKAQSEHQETRYMNLQLLQRYGQQSWSKYIKNSEQLVQQLTNKHKDIQQQIEQININRKLDQDQILQSLQNNQNKWFELVYKNQAIESECLKLEQEIEALQLEKQQHTDSNGK